VLPQSPSPSAPAPATPSSPCVVSRSPSIEAVSSHGIASSIYHFSSSCTLPSFLHINSVIRSHSHSPLLGDLVRWLHGPHLHLTWSYAFRCCSLALGGTPFPPSFLDCKLLKAVGSASVAPPRQPDTAATLDQEHKCCPPMRWHREPSAPDLI
jgi:hypothetical protein